MHKRGAVTPQVPEVRNNLLDEKRPPFGGRLFPARCLRQKPLVLMIDPMAWQMTPTKIS